MLDIVILDFHLIYEYMIENDTDKYTVSPVWILRDDSYYHTKYTFFNVENRLLMSMSRALFCILKMLYSNALSMSDIRSFLNRNGIVFDYEVLNHVMRQNHAEDLLIKSKSPFHTPLPDIGLEHVSNVAVPVSTTPIDAEIHFTHNCNLLCTHCFQHSQRHSDRRKHLTVREWMNIFRQFEDLNMHNVIISGGEPLFYESFGDIIEMIEKMRLNVTILTNGMLINEHNVNLFKRKIFT